MADIYRYKYGETNPVAVATKSGVALQVGDLCFEDETDGYTVKPASSQAWTTDAPTTRTNFAAHFLGVNEQRWDGTNLPTGNKDGTNRVATGGIFDFACAAGSSFNAGDLVGPDSSGTTLLNQQVIKANGRSDAIGRVERSVTNASTVRVRIFTAKLAPLTNA